MTTSNTTNHIGRKIARLRELRGMKQESLADELGISQQSVSLLERSEKLDQEKLEEVAKALGVSSDAIEHFSEESVLNILSNSFHDHSALNAILHNPTFNPLEKVVELFEEKEKLYERLLQAEKDKVAYLEELLKMFRTT